jgi:hypothetical protein
LHINFAGLRFGQRSLRTKGVEIMAKMQSKNLSKPDELRTFDQGKLELIKLGGITFGRATLQPGWNGPRASNRW